jgi:hypothetical protein
MYSIIASLGLFLLVSISYFFYTYPDESSFTSKLDSTQYRLFMNYMNILKKTWLESLIIGLVFSVVLYLIMINKKITFPN